MALVGTNPVFHLAAELDSLRGDLVAIVSRLEESLRRAVHREIREVGVALRDCRSAAGQGAARYLPPAVARLTAALAEFREAVRVERLTALERRHSQDPTRLPALNRVLNGAWLLTRGRLEAAAFQGLVERARGVFREGALRNPAYRRLLAVLDQYEDWARQPRAEDLDRLAAASIAADQALRCATSS